MIRVDNLSFAYEKDIIIDKLSFEFGEGSLIAVLGPNGAGKSTLFKCIMGLLKGYTGDIYLDNKDISKLKHKEIAKLAAYIPQSEAPTFNYSVWETVLMGTSGMISPFRSPGEQEISTARESMEYLGISHLANRGVEELSGGERQLVLIARAMAQNAKILIMDEPTANLDYGNQQRVLRHIKKMTKEGYTVILSTHVPAHALQYADQVLAIKDHRIIATGDARVLLTEKIIKTIYDLDVRILEIPIDGTLVRTCIPVDIIE